MPPQSRLESQNYPHSLNETTHEIALSKDNMFKMLSNRRRRLAVQFLRDQPNGSLPIRELSDLIAAAENEIPVEEVTYKQRKRVHISLYQTHLSALHSNGIVDYDSRSGNVKLMPTSREFSQHIDMMAADELGWGEIWLALSAVCLAFGVATWTELLPYFGTRPEIAILVLSLVVCVTAVWFYLSSIQIQL